MRHSAPNTSPALARLALLAALMALAVACWAAGNPRPAPADPTLARRLDLVERAIGNDRRALADHERRLTVVETETLLATGGKRP